MGMIFLQDALGTKIDLLLAEMPFDRMVIERARKVTVAADIVATLCTPEDLIIYKMLSTRLRDREDVKGIVRRQRDQLDRTYVLRWLRDFELALDDSTLDRRLGLAVVCHHGYTYGNRAASRRAADPFLSRQPRASTGALPR